MSNMKGFIFDMDGVLTDTEQIWSVAMREICHNHGGKYTHEQKMVMIGMSTPEWSTHMAEYMNVPLTPPEIADTVEDRVLELFEEHLPLIPGAIDAVKRLSESFTIAIASSSALRVIERAVHAMGIDCLLTAKVSAEEVESGKPAPDVYLEAVRRLGFEPSECAAIEDSSSGMRAAHAAGLTTLGFPHAEFPAAADALALCDRVLSSMDELTGDLVARLQSSTSTVSH